jgi:hypothetical protein
LEATIKVGFESGHLLLDTTGFFEGSGYQGVKLASDTPNTRSLSLDLAEMKTEAVDIRFAEAVKNLANADLALRAVGSVSSVLNIAGGLGAVVELYEITMAATKAHDAGDNAKAATIVASGLAQMGTGFAVGTAAGEFSAAFFAALLPFTPVGIVVGAALAIGVGIAAGIGGATAV